MTKLEALQTLIALVDTAEAQHGTEVRLGCQLVLLSLPGVLCAAVRSSIADLWAWV